MKFSNLFKPTPRKMRRLGNAMVAAATGIAVPTALMGNVTIGIVIMVIGGIGKFITEWFAEEPADEQK